jgi:iron complex outermembrane recepter protein
MSNAQWLSNPFLNKGITHQQYLIDGWGVNSNVEIAAGINLGLQYQDQSKKSSVAYWYGGNSDYDYSQQNTELSISGRNQDIKWVGGVQISNGSRFDNVSAYALKKDNQSIFGQFHKYFGNLVWMLGAREEQVHYEYSQAGNASLSQNNKLPQWETGLNYIQDENTSWFGTYSRSYQSPDVDRFFNATYDVNNHVTGESFNGFIVPALAKTATIGFNLKTEQNKLTASLYRANLTNEIYYDNVNHNNTNIDVSHKQGFELRDRWAINDKVLMHSNYTYTVAKIDNANSTNPAFAGKNLPGVSRHMLVWGVRLNPYGNHTLNLNQTWRSRAYALDDFLNNYAVQIPIQRSTDATYQYAFT